jgi:hypothetical protein
MALPVNRREKSRRTALRRIRAPIVERQRDPYHTGQEMSRKGGGDKTPAGQTFMNSISFAG